MRRMEEEIKNEKLEISFQSQNAFSKIAPALPQLEGDKQISHSQNTQEGQQQMSFDLPSDLRSIDQLSERLKISPTKKLAKNDQTYYSNWDCHYDEDFSYTEGCFPSPSKELDEKKFDNRQYLYEKKKHGVLDFKQEFIKQQQKQQNCEESQNIPSSANLNCSITKLDEFSARKKCNRENYNEENICNSEISKDECMLSVKQALESLQDNQSLLKFFLNWKVQSKNQVCFNEILNSETGKLKRYKNGAYFGGFSNNQRCGFGIMMYKEGKVYEGEWQNDSKFGKGYEQYPNKNYYQGTFLNGQMEGIGIYYWQNGEIFEGQWIGGMKHGSGIWSGIKNDSYIGEWKFGRPDGYGVHTWMNGDRYEGQFKASLKHGEGKEIFANGDSFKGQYANGKPEGIGQYCWVDGSSYNGEFKNGLRHGKGIWKRKNKENDGIDYFEGDFLNDKKSGFGIFRWFSGNVYRGEFFDDMKQGFGIMEFADGSIYEGQWERGQQSGHGELIIPFKGTLQGLFRENKFIGADDELDNHQQIKQCQTKEVKMEDSPFSIRQKQQTCLRRKQSLIKSQSMSKEFQKRENNQNNSKMVTNFDKEVEDPLKFQITKNNFKSKNKRFVQNLSTIEDNKRKQLKKAYEILPAFQITKRLFQKKEEYERKVTNKLPDEEVQMQEGDQNVVKLKDLFSKENQKINKDPKDINPHFIKTQYKSPYEQILWKTLKKKNRSLSPNLQQLRTKNQDIEQPDRKDKLNLFLNPLINEQKKQYLDSKDKQYFTIDSSNVKYVKSIPNRKIINDNNKSLTLNDVNCITTTRDRFNISNTNIYFQDNNKTRTISSWRPVGISPAHNQGVINIIGDRNCGLNQKQNPLFSAKSQKNKICFTKKFEF